MLEEELDVWACSLPRGQLTHVSLFSRGEELRCCSIRTTTIMKQKPKKTLHHHRWEKLLEYRSNSFILSFLSLFLYVKLLVQRILRPPDPPIILTTPSGGAWFEVQGVAAIFHSHLQSCLDETGEICQTRNREREGTKPETSQRGFDHLFVFKYLEMICQYLCVN